ncbi:MAG: HAD family hydrolase [Butyricicoccaceae bacterium]
MKYFVFDVDGTLLNSAEVDQQCLKQTLHEFGRDYTFEELRPSFGKPGRQTLADLGFTGETAERIMDRWEGLSKERASEVLAFDGIEA